MRAPRKPHEPQIIDEPGMEERFQRVLRNALNTPPKHRTALMPKAKKRPTSEEGVHKGKTRS
jgi:hypothetical protein